MKTVSDFSAPSPLPSPLPSPDTTANVSCNKVQSGFSTGHSAFRNKGAHQRRNRVASCDNARVSFDSQLPGERVFCVYDSDSDDDDSDNNVIQWAIAGRELPCRKGHLNLACLSSVPRGENFRHQQWLQCLELHNAFLFHPAERGTIWTNKEPLKFGGGAQHARRRLWMAAKLIGRGYQLLEVDTDRTGRLLLIRRVFGGELEVRVVPHVMLQGALLGVVLPCEQQSSFNIPDLLTTHMFSNFRGCC